MFSGGQWPAHVFNTYIPLKNQVKPLMWTKAPPKPRPLYKRTHTHIHTHTDNTSGHAVFVPIVTTTHSACCCAPVAHSLLDHAPPAHLLATLLHTALSHDHQNKNLIYSIRSAKVHVYKVHMYIRSTKVCTQGAYTSYVVVVDTDENHGVCYYEFELSIVACFVTELFRSIY